MKQLHGLKAARLVLPALVTALTAISTWFARDVRVDVPFGLPQPGVPVSLAWVPVLLGLLTLTLMVHRARRPRPDSGAPEPVPAEVADGATPPIEDHHQDAPVPPPAGEDAGAVTWAPPEAATDGDPSAVVLELDARSRVVRAAGAPLSFLHPGPAVLQGHSLLEIVPAPIHASVVDAVRAARGAPGTALDLPKLRLHQPGDSGRRSAPLRLCVVADDAGRLRADGHSAEPQNRLPVPELGASDDRFSRVFHMSPDVIIIIRYHDGVVVDFNESFTRLIGYTREDAIGQAIGELDLFADPDDRLELVSRFSQERQVTDLEVLLQGCDQRQVPVDLSMRFIELDGELCVLCIARDISRRREAERAAERNQNKFSQVFNRSPDGVLILSPDLTIQDANPAAEAGSGYPRDQLIGQSVYLFEPEAGGANTREAFETLEREGHLSNREMRIRGASGRELTVLVSGTLTDIDGESRILCIVKDVSELRRTEEQLRRSEERFRGAFENAPIGILLLDPQGHIFQANRFVTELLRYPQQSLDRLHVSRLVPTDERAELKEQLERLQRGGEPALRAERRLLCADGLEIWTNCHLVLQRGGDGQPLYSIMQIADITEMKTSQRRMERLAFYDTLTELANRRLFNDRLQHAAEHCRRHDLRAALLYLDLDQFKRVNDTLGHESGDVLLKEVATRLLGCVRKEDTVGRPGGDEFTILLYDIDSPADAGKVAEKILRELERPIMISGHQLVVTTSIGITVLPDDGDEPNALTKNADLAMYRAKEQGRNNYQFFSEELNTNAVHRLRTEYELRRALDRSEFELHFQPTIRLADQSIVGAECLLRWNHPERGMVLPGDFITIAEETGAIVEIGNWVIEQACAAGRMLADHHGGPLCVAVNISPRQFRDPNLVEVIRRSLRSAGLEPSLLELEITETMLMEDVESTAEIVESLHHLGVRIAIDDFGTGYSSLNYLKKFPIHTVKVDRTFVADIPDSSDDMEITAAVIAMAHRLRMEVVAEGVETRAQLEFLSEQQCDFAQGYLFSRALPLKQVCELLGPGVALLHHG